MGEKGKHDYHYTLFWPVAVIEKYGNRKLIMQDMISEYCVEWDKWQWMESRIQNYKKKEYWYEISSINCDFDFLFLWSNVFSW